MLEPLASRILLGRVRTFSTHAGTTDVALWSRRRYPAADIASVTWEKGGGVYVKLKAGGWAKLPELGYNAQGLTNTVRAWLERHRAERQA